MFCTISYSDWNLIVCCARLAVPYFVILASTLNLLDRDSLELQLLNDLRRVDECTSLLNSLTADRRASIKRVKTLFIATNHIDTSLVGAIKDRLPSFESAAVLERRDTFRRKGRPASRFPNGELLVRGCGVVGVVVDCGHR